MIQKKQDAKKHDTKILDTKKHDTERDVKITHEVYTQRNIFEILLNQPEIRLYLPFPD